MSRSDVYGAARREREQRLKLNQDVEKLFNRCGKWAHLIPDSLLLAKDITDMYGPGLQGAITKQEAGDTVTWISDEPVMAAMLEVTDAAASRCRHCQPREPLRIVSINRSGSSAEGLDDGLVGGGGTSDFDVMYEFDGPFRWAAVGTATEPAVIGPQAAPHHSSLLLISWRLTMAAAIVSSVAFRGFYLCFRQCLNLKTCTCTL